MATKFLPFIVENSTPLHIYQTILFRSKGMKMHTVLSVFNILLNTPIRTVRDFVKTLPDLPLERVYEQIIARYPDKKLPVEKLDSLLALQKRYIIPENAWPELSEFSTLDALGFLYVLSFHKDADVEVGEYVTGRFEELPMLTEEKVFSAFKFSEEGKAIQFKNKKLFDAFLLGAYLFDEVPSYAIKVVSGTTSEDSAPAEDSNETS